MSGNRRHAGGMKSAMENLKKIDERIVAAKEHQHSADASGYKCRDCNAVWDWQTAKWTDHAHDVPREQPCYRGNDWCPVGCCSHLFKP